MNYRHIYHAGNFADVVKHAVLALVIERLKLKDAAFRVIDTHAGLGIYDLDADEAQRTGEWVGGIGRLFGPSAAPIPAAQAALLAPYLGAVVECNPSGAPVHYPGSPKIARALLRPQDTLVVNELHSEDAAELRRVFARDAQVKVMELDGWVALKALLPPKERRGVVLIDPPFEVPGEHGRLVEALRQAVKRFATGVYMLWYPIKDRAQTERFKKDLKASGLAKLLTVELSIRPDGEGSGLGGTGLAIHNPPYGLEADLSVIMPFLRDLLAVDRGGHCSVDWLNGEM